MDKIKLKAKEDGMESWIWARVLDIYEEEQERGKTHEFDSILFVNKKTGKEYELIDTPGHQKFIRSMIEGISKNVNIGMVLISMKDNEFESSVGNGMMKEHLILCRSVGIEHLVLVANKMDAIDWDEKKCKEKVMLVTKYLVKELCWPKEKLYVVPISAFSGIGLTDIEGIPAWYKGKSFLDTLDSINDAKILNTSEESKKCKRFVCDFTNLGSASSCEIISTISNEQETYNQTSIISPGSLFVMHYGGNEVSVTVEKISNKGKPFIKSGEEAKCIMNTSEEISISIGTRVVFRKANNTIGFGTISKIF